MACGLALADLSHHGLVHQHGIVADEGGGHLYKADRSGDAAIIPPVAVVGGHAVFFAGVVYQHYQGIVAGFKKPGNLDIEWGEATFVASQALAVKRDYGSMVDGSEIDEIPFALKGFRTEFGAVPDASLIIIELFVLGVPVSGDADVSGAVEAVFY